MNLLIALVSFPIISITVYFLKIFVADMLGNIWKSIRYFFTFKFIACFLAFISIFVDIFLDAIIGIFLSFYVSIKQTIKIAKDETSLYYGIIDAYRDIKEYSFIKKVLR